MNENAEKSMFLMNIFIKIKIMNNNNNNENNVFNE